MNIKKVSVVAALLALLLFVAACGSNGNSTSGGNATGSNAASGNAESGNEAGNTVEYPTKPIELIVPFDAGGISDILARAFADAAQGIISQPVTVKNIGGGSGTIGNYELVKSAPDGYTWLWAANGHIASTLHITEAQYTKDDFIIVNRAGEMSGTVVVPKDSPFNSLHDLIEYAEANPGKLTVGLPGEGTVVALLANMLADEVGVQFEFVPFQGSGPLLPAVLGGHVQAAFMNVPEVRGQVEAGELRALAVLSEQRVDVFPDVPTAVESGYNIAGGASHYIIIPLNVPDEIVAEIDALTKQVYESEKFKQKMADINYQLGYKNGADARAEVDEWYEKTGELYRKLGLAK
jgi:tripartite-type tricarboxylate transporter receptor subunit TctC